MTVTCRRAIIALFVVVLWYPAMASGQTPLLNDLQLLLAQERSWGTSSAAPWPSAATATRLRWERQDPRAVCTSPPRGRRLRLRARSDIRRVVAAGEADRKHRRRIARPQDHFGAALAISEDGNTLVIGAPWPGGDQCLRSAYVFHREGTAWTMSPAIDSGAPGRLAPPSPSWKHAGGRSAARWISIAARERCSCIDVALPTGSLPPS